MNGSHTCTNKESWYLGFHGLVPPFTNEFRWALVLYVVFFLCGNIYLIMRELEMYNGGEGYEEKKSCRGLSI